MSLRSALQWAVGDAKTDARCPSSSNGGSAQSTPLRPREKTPRLGSGSGSGGGGGGGGSGGRALEGALGEAASAAASTEASAAGAGLADLAAVVRALLEPPPVGCPWTAAVTPGEILGWLRSEVCVA